MSKKASKKSKAEAQKIETPALETQAPAPKPVIRSSARFAVAGALLPADAGPRLEAVGQDLIRDQWTLINPARQAGNMRAYVGTVLTQSAERRDGIDYHAYVVDCGSALVRIRTKQVLFLNTEVYFRAEPVDMVEGEVIETKGVRSLRQRLEKDPEPGVHSY